MGYAAIFLDKPVKWVHIKERTLFDYTLLRKMGYILCLYGGAVGSTALKARL